MFFFIESFHFRRLRRKVKFFFRYKSLYFECYATMPIFADAYISSLGYLWCMAPFVASPQASCGVCFCSSRIHFSPRTAGGYKVLRTADGWNIRSIFEEHAGSSQRLSVAFTERYFHPRGVTLRKGCAMPILMSGALGRTVI